MRFLPVLLTMGVLATSGCKVAQGVGARLTGGIPSRLTGVWTVVRSGEIKSSGALELRSNGTFVARDLPDDVLDDLDSASPEYLSGSGDWTYPRDAGPKRVVLVFRQLRGIRHDVPVRAELQFEERRQSPLLTFHVGDPDEDERVSLQLTDAGEGTAR